MSFRGGRNKGTSTFSNLPFGLNYSDVSVAESSELPSIPLPVNNPVNIGEREVSLNYINFKNALRNGPFYTGSMSLVIEETENGTSNGKAKKRKQQIDADGLNDGIERYSDKYLKRRKIGTSIDDHPYNLEFFPSELYQVMGINKKKLLQLSKINKQSTIFTGDNTSKEAEESAALSMLEKLKDIAEDEDEDGDHPNEENKNGVEEDIDDEFEEEDDDDYNAEKYFDDGDDDYGGEDDYGDEPAF